MAQTVKERLAALKTKKANVAKEAKVAVVAAWTVAKTLLPGAPTEIQHRFASAIVDLDNKILKSALKQTAVNSYWAKFAEDMDAAGCGLNKFVEDESMLTKLQGELRRELQGQAKNASEDVCAEEVKTATGVPEVEGIPSETRHDSDAPKIAEFTDPAQAAEEQNAADKASLADQVAQTEGAVSGLEEQVMDEEAGQESGEGLNFDELFASTDGKVEDLANEGDGDSQGGDGSLDGLFGDEDPFGNQAGDDEQGFMGEGGEFGPSSTGSLEGALDGLDEVEMSDAADFFSQASEEDGSLDDLFKTSADGVEVEVGEAADFFANGAVGDDPFGPEEDHADDLIFDVMKDYKPESYKSKRDTEPKLETPKKASKPMRSLGHVTTESAEQAMLARLVFPEDEEY